MKRGFQFEFEERLKAMAASGVNQETGTFFCYNIPAWTAALSPRFDLVCHGATAEYRPA